MDVDKVAALRNASALSLLTALCVAPEQPSAEIIANCSGMNAYGWSINETNQQTCIADVDYFLDHCEDFCLDLCSSSYHGSDKGWLQYCTIPQGLSTYVGQAYCNCSC